MPDTLIIQINVDIEEDEESTVEEKDAFVRAYLHDCKVNVPQLYDTGVTVTSATYNSTVAGSGDL